jgi:hypothetical protein
VSAKGNGSTDHELAEYCGQAAVSQSLSNTESQTLKQAAGATHPHAGENGIASFFCPGRPRRSFVSVKGCRKFRSFELLEGISRTELIV